MTNYEKFKDEIKQALNDETLGDWCWGKGIYMLTDTALYSAVKIAMWLLDEYEEKEGH